MVNIGLSNIIWMVKLFYRCRFFLSIRLLAVDIIHYLFLFMYRTLVTRLCFYRVYPRVNIHLSTPKLEGVSSKDGQQAKSSSANDEVKFDYINKTGIIQLNKPKTLNALSLSMIEQIYPKMKV